MKYVYTSLVLLVVITIMYLSIVIIKFDEKHYREIEKTIERIEAQNYSNYYRSN